MRFKVVRPRLKDEHERKVARAFTLTPKVKRMIQVTAGRQKPRVTASSLVEALCKSEEALEKAKTHIEKMVKENGGQLPAPKQRYGESKERKSYTLSDYADSALKAWSMKLWISKAEVIECAVRGGGLEDAIAYLQGKS